MGGMSHGCLVPAVVFLWANSPPQQGSLGQWTCYGGSEESEKKQVWRSYLAVHQETYS